MTFIEVINYVFFGMPYLMAVVLGLLVTYACVAVYGRPGVAGILIGLGYLQAVLLPGLLGLPLGPVKIEFIDLITLLLAATAVLRLGTAHHLPRMPTSFWVALGAMGISFAIGTVQFKTAAGVSFRPYFHMVATALYFSTIPFDERMQRVLVRTWSVVAVGLILVCAFRWSGVLSGFDRAASGEFGELDRIRVLTSVHALLLLQMAILIMLGQRQLFPRPVTIGFGIVLLLITLILQHRSVWLAGLVAAFSILLTRERRNVGMVLLSAAVVALIFVVFSLYDIGDAFFGEVSRSAARAVSGADTAQARLDTWAFTLNKWRTSGPVAWMVGVPFGTDMQRVVVNSTGDLQKVSFQAHSFFVQTLFNVGLVGLGSVVTFFFAIGRRLRRLAHDGDRGPWPSMLFVLFVSQVTYYLTYGVSFEDGLLIGLCASMAFARPAAQVAQDLARRRRASVVAMPKPRSV